MNRRTKTEKRKGHRNVAHVSPDLQFVLDAIQSDPIAKKALRTLTEAGCDQNALILNLFLYYGGNATQVKKSLRGARYSLERLSKLATQLEKDASEIKEVLADLRTEGIKIYGFDLLPERLRSFADILPRMRRARQRVAVREQEMTGYLVYLVCLIRGVTGHPHYNELAALSDAVKPRIDCTVVQLADAIRNTVNRYRKSHSADFEMFALESEKEVSGWRARQEKGSRH
jgi:hypothetical protein